MYLGLIRARARVVLPLVVVALTSSVAACGSSGGTASAGGSPGKVTVGSMIWDTSVPFYANMIKGEKDAAKKYNVNLKIVSGNGDISQEVSAVQQFVTEKVNAILVTPSSPTGIVPAVRLANQAKIPVFAVNNAVGKGAQIVTYVGASDYTYGQQQARLLVKAIGTKGKIAYILGELGTSAQLDREAGFKSVLKKYPGIQIVATQTAKWDSSQALSVVQDWAGRYPKGTLDAIVDQGPEGASAARYLANSGRTDIKFIVGDYPSSVRTEILQHQLFGTVDQNPYPQGFLGVKYASWYLNGKAGSVPKPHAYQPLPIITAANAQKTPPAWKG